MFRHLCWWNFMCVASDFSGRHNFTANSPCLCLLPMAQLFTEPSVSVILLLTGKFYTYPSSRKPLFVTDRNHYRKHNDLKCRVVEPSPNCIFIGCVLKIIIKKTTHFFSSSHQLPIAHKIVVCLCDSCPMICLIFVGLVEATVAALPLLPILWLLHSFYPSFFSALWNFRV